MRNNEEVGEIEGPSRRLLRNNQKLTVVNHSIEKDDIEIRNFKIPAEFLRFLTAV